MVEKLAVLGLLVPGCLCSDPSPSSGTPIEPPSFPSERTAFAAQPISDNYCKSACSACRAVSCEKMFNTLCGGDTASNYASIGGYILPCTAAVMPACYQYSDTAMAKCIRVCLGGNGDGGGRESESSSTPTVADPPPDPGPPSDPGDPFGDASGRVR